VSGTAPGGGAAGSGSPGRASSGPLGPGAVIGGRYVLVRRLGAGGFGAVWLARDREARGVERPVAIKLLHPELLALRGKDFARFRREAEILGQLDHPAISRALAYDLDGEHAFIVMEHVDGLPLDRLVYGAAQRGGALDPADAARIFDEMAGAVAYAHGLGIVHRDLKPKNVMVVRRAERVFVKVLDFGIARVAGEAGDGGTTIGRVIGSYFYMAPEQVRGERPDARADVFALGTILFELLTGHRAWAQDAEGRPIAAHRPITKSSPNTLAEITLRLLSGPRPVPSDLVEGLPLALDEVVARALAIEPEARFPTVLALADAARPHLAERRTGTGLTVVALEPELRAALLGEAGQPVVEEERVRVASPGEAEPPGSSGSAPLVVPLDTPDPGVVVRGAPGTQAPREETPLVWASRSLGPAPPTQRWRDARVIGLALGAGALVVLGLLAGGVALGVRLARQDEAELEALRDSRERAARASPSGSTEVRVTAPVAVQPSVAASTASASAAQGGGEARPMPQAPSVTVAPRRSTAPPGVAGSGASSPATTSPPEARPSELTRLLAAARAPGAELSRLTALGDALRAEALRRPTGPTRTRVLRMVEASLAYGDVDGLAAAVELLETTQ
jgi:serine/threonine protein kinase